MNKLLASVFALVFSTTAANAQFSEFGPFNLPWGGGGGGSSITASSITTFTNKTINCANNTCTVRLGSDVTGTLPYGNGGTGATSFTNHGAVVAGASALTTVAPGTSGNIFTSNGTDWLSSAPATNGTVTSLSLSPGFTKTIGTQNTGSDAITTTGTINGQLWPVNKAVSYTVATADTGVLLIATAGSVVFTLPNPASGTKGTTYQFASDGTNGYSLTTPGGTATFYGCTVTSGTTTAVIANKVDTLVVDDGTNYKCTSVSGIPPVSPSFTTPALGTPSALVLTNATGLPAAQVPAVLTPTPATTHTLTAPREYYACTGTCTVTVPVPAAGYEFCVFNDDNVSTAITLAALGSSAMYENSARTAYGTAGTGTLVLSAAAANKVCFVGRDSTHYWTLSYNGAVTVN